MYHELVSLNFCAVMHNTLSEVFIRNEIYYIVLTEIVFKHFFWMEAMFGETKSSFLTETNITIHYLE